MNYLMVLPVPFYRLSEDEIATESAFREHLVQFKASLGPDVRELTITAPVLTAADYENSKSHFASLSQEDDGIRLVPMEPAGSSRLRYWQKYLWQNFRIIWSEVGKADVVHAGPSLVYLPREFLGIMAAILRGKKSVFVVDIDWRRSAWMNYQTGRYSLKSYLLARYCYSPLFGLQVRIASRFCSLVLLKSAKLVRDYGKGRRSVKNVLDAAHSSQYILDDDALARKLTRIQSESDILRLVYFGRLTAYKGIDRMLEVVALLQDRPGKAVAFDVIGAGEENQRLRDRCAELGISACVRFRGAIQFGPQLFEALQEAHILLAAPLSEDTPRSALDAMAAGLALVAYDTDYYVDLESASKAIVTVPWRSNARMAAALVDLDQDRARLAGMAEAAVKFARANTQEIWLERRAAWFREFCVDMP